MKKRSEILNELIDLVPMDASRRFKCFMCHGDNTLSITKMGSEVRYNCFRAECKLGGSRRIQATLDSLKTRLNGSQELEAEFSIPDYWVKGISSVAMLQMLLKTNSHKAYVEGLFKIAYDPKENRFVYLIQNENKIVGAVGRALSNVRPKTKNYPSNSFCPFMCGSGETLVLVEDCASACSVASAGYKGMALLGTNLLEEYVPYVVGHKNIIVALDYDARKKALDIKNKLRYYCDSVKVVILTKDLKDMDNAGIQNNLIG